MSKPRKPRICKWCGDEFMPFKTTEKVCSTFCAIELAKVQGKEKERRKTKKALKKLNEESKPWQLKQTQIAFNKFIRTRDYGERCISCGRNSGAKMNAGHYRSVGAAPHLRFNEDNCHLQCERCNSYLSGNIVEYRPHLISKIGVDAVEALEADNDAKNYTIADLVELRKYYKDKTKELKDKLSSDY